MLFDEPSRQPLPNEPELADHRAAVIKGALGSIPVLGNVLAEELGLLLAPPLTQRRDAWLEDLARRLRDLEAKITGFRFDDLCNNEQFVSATAQATQAVLRTHQVEKLAALRNAVLNVATGKELDTDRQAQFVALVDRFASAHLTLLRFFQDPAGHFSRRGIAPPATFSQAELLAYQLVSAAMPEFCQQMQSPSTDRSASKFQLLQMFFDDLTSAKLIALKRIKDNEAWVIPRFSHPVPYPLAPLTTDLGDDFLTFIGEPRTGEEQS